MLALLHLLRIGSRRAHLPVWAGVLSMVLLLPFSLPAQAPAQGPTLITELGFQVGAGIPYGLGPTSLAVADFNGDGIRDVAVLNTDTSTTNPVILVYLGNGDGTFKTPVNYLDGYVAQSLVIGDFNGDGKPDLCVLDQNSGLLVLLGNGDGTFQNPVSSSLGGGQSIPFYIGAGDFNGDGKLDLAVAGYVPGNGNKGDVMLFLGNGDGTFAAPTTPISGLITPLQIAVADIANNGKSDIVLATYSGIDVLLGDGAGGFSTPVTYLNGSTSFVIADVNGDGIPDLVAEPNSGTTLDFLAGKGDGTFETPTGTALPSGFSGGETAGSIAAGDFDGDGHIDVFISGSASSNNLLLFGNGDGTFQAPIQLGASLPQADNLAAVAAVAADLNGDQKSDVVFVDPYGGWLVSLLSTQGTVGALIFPAVYDFGLQTVGAPTTTTTVTIANPGTTAMQFSNLAVDDAADFSANSSCGPSIAPTDICSVTISFNPQSAGEKTATVSFTSNDPIAAGSRIKVTGNAIAPAVLTNPLEVQFSYQKVGTTSSPQTVQITNSGIGPLTLAVTIQGDFAQTNNCPASLAQGANCTATITFAPEVPGSETGRLVMTTNAVPAQSAVALTGIGYVVGPVISVSPPTFNFGSQYVGTSSAPSVVTVENTGDAPFTISSVTATAGFVPLSTCGNNVQPSFSCAIGIFFDPANTGSQTGTLTIVDNLPTSPQSVTLIGNGTAISVGASTGSSTAQTLASGQAAYQMSISPVSGYKGTVNLSCLGVAAGLTCSLSPSSAALDGSASASVTVSVTSSTSAAAAAHGSPAPGAIGRVVLAFPIALIFLGAGIFPRWRRRFLAIGLLVVVGAFAGSCGGVSKTTTTGSSQTYVFFLESQPASGITIDTPLTLTVQN